MMWTYRQLWIPAVAAFLAVACLGCGNGESPDDPNGRPGSNGNGPDTPNGGSQTQNGPQNEDPPHVRTMPKVVLTQEQLDKCHVRDGDMMPDEELPGLDGNPQTLAALRAGQKLTVVCFWKSGETDRGRLKAIEIVGELQALSESYSGKGVRVIGINEGDPAETVREQVAAAEANFPNLLDADGVLFHKVATEGLPRVYLLGPEGRILWFDLEFSLTTGRRLEEGIQAEL